MLKEKVLKKIKYIVIVFSLVVNTSPSLYSQDKVSAFNRLSPDQVLTIMRKFHPVIRQANIQVEISENDILNSRGSFDPFLSGKMGAKNLKQEDYYQSKELGLEIPTWYGIDFEAGIANMTGQRLDNAITTGNTSFVGVNIPLLKNLVYDKRRGYLEQAKSSQQRGK
jgi:hypothetical protein